jgi:hypothetical protein
LDRIPFRASSLPITVPPVMGVCFRTQTMVQLGRR